MYCGDIGISKNHQKFEALHGADAIRQHARRGGIVQVARVHDGGQIQMMLDQEFHRGPVLGRHFKPLHRLACQLYGSMRMMA